MGKDFKFLVELLMENLKFFLELLTLAFVICTYFNMISKPRIKASFYLDDKHKELITLSTGINTIPIILQNKGSVWDIRRPAATQVTAFIYFPDSFYIIEARRPDAPTIKSSDVFVASPVGSFKGKKYIAIPAAYKVFPPKISMLSLGEAILCEVDIVAPNQSTREEVLIQIISAEGDLGTHKLFVKIT